MPRENDAKKLERYEAALAQFVERVMADRYVLAVVTGDGPGSVDYRFTIESEK